MPRTAIHTHDKFIDIQGDSLFVRTWVPGDIREQVPLVLLHDSLGCVALWKEFPEALAKELRRPIIAYDRLGYGQSGIRKDRLSSDFMREEVKVFSLIREALGFEDYALFGHSTGGSIALEVAAMDVTRCVAVITESAHAFVESRTLDGVRAARVRFANQEKFERLIKQHGDKARWVLDAWITTWLSPAFSEWSLAEALPGIQCPVVAFHCRDDKYGSPVHAQVIADTSGGEAILLEGCGHIPHKNWEREVIEKIKEVLESK